MRLTFRDGILYFVMIIPEQSSQEKFPANLQETRADELWTNLCLDSIRAFTQLSIFLWKTSERSFLKGHRTFATIMLP